MTQACWRAARLLPLVRVRAAGGLLRRDRSPARCSTRPGSPAGTRHRSRMPTEDYFHDMDGGIALSPEEIKGRNMWLVWSGGNDRFWNQMTDYTFGAFDLLKIISSHPSLGYSRANRWKYFGLVNEPCFEQRRRPRQGTGAASGSTCAARTARPIPSRTKASTPAWPSARAASRWATARPSRSALSTAGPPASPACACFPIRTSTRRPPRSGTRRSTTPIRATTTARTWCGRTASACRAASATSGRAR